MKKLVIFDLDGTLINSIKDLAISTNYALEQLNFPTHPIEKYNLMIGNGINKLFERALPDGKKTEENIIRMREIFLVHYDQYNAVYTHPYEGIPELLEELQKKDILLAVASNKYQQATEKLVHYFFPNIEFEQILGQRKEVPTKPDPTILLEIMENTNIPTHKTLMVGDSNIDMETANRGQIDACGVSWGFRSIEELKSKHPKYIVN
ncbi:MAG: HAD family hydrolase, partial [Bacteroidales bacterium]|nr:HAD family hydrolase [Bacteroidales bacterium]